MFEGLIACAVERIHARHSPHPIILMNDAVRVTDSRWARDQTGAEARCARSNSMISLGISAVTDITRSSVKHAASPAHSTEASAITSP